MGLQERIAKEAQASMETMADYRRARESGLEKVRTVGELMDELAKWPREMRVVTANPYEPGEYDTIFTVQSADVILYWGQGGGGEHLDAGKKKIEGVSYPDPEQALVIE